MKLYRLILTLFVLLFITGNVKADGDDMLEYIVRLPKMRITVYSLLGKISEFGSLIPLQEVLIRLVEPQKLLREIMESRKRNYLSVSVYLTTFYREGVCLKDKFQSLTEAVF